MPITERRGDRDAKSGEATGLWFKGEQLEDLPEQERQRRAQLRDNPLRANSRLGKSRLEKSDILAQARARWQLVTQDAAQLPTMWTTSPLVVGLGQSTTLETAVTLHPLYGFPYIPGSSVKGVARAAAFYAIAEQLGVPGLDNETYQSYKDNGRSTPFKLLQDVLEADDKEKWPNVPALAALQKDKHVDSKNLTNHLTQLPEVKLFRQIFGWLGQAGQIIFYDAIPAEIPRLTTEVMTPHFPKYYSKGENPTDADSPNPVTFLTVASGTPFLFAVGWRYLDSTVETPVRQAAKWLINGLQTLGIGGKTSSGYGFFIRTEQPSTRERPSGSQELRFYYSNKDK
jgi:CRISPR-associated protein Cmr6